MTADLPPVWLRARQRRRTAPLQDAGASSHALHAGRSFLAASRAFAMPTSDPPAIAHFYWIEPGQRGVYNTGMKPSSTGFLASRNN